MSRMRDAALALAQRGPVFPCAQDKAPLVARGFHAATTDPAAIRDWWTRWPDALIAVPTGEKFCVLDVDLKHPDAERWYAENCSNIPFTRKHFTRSGGYHLLFVPDPRMRCTAGRIARGVDTRGVGGYIIWWPLHGFAVSHRALLAAVPEFIIEAQLPKPEPIAIKRALPHVSGRELARRKLCGLMRTIVDAHEGERNAITFWVGCRLAEMVAAGEISHGDAVGLGIEAAAHAGLPRAEARSTLRSAFRRGGYQ
jgi:Bifunctional DNA primase/polymerase, N-terminal